MNAVQKLRATKGRNRSHSLGAGGLRSAIVVNGGAFNSVCTKSSEEDSDVPENITESASSGSLRRRSSSRSKLAQESHSSDDAVFGADVVNGSSSSSSERELAQRAAIPKSKSFSSRIKKKIFGLQTISEDSVIPASLILYFKDVMCLSRPSVIIVPNNQITHNLRVILELSHECEWSLRSESSAYNWETKSQILYLLDATLPSVRTWAKEKHVFSSALYDIHGNKMLPGHLSRVYGTKASTRAQGNVITHWYLIKRPL